MAAKHNFTAISQMIHQGSDWFRPLRWEENDAIKDVTGYTARMHIRAALEAPDELVELTTENGRITLGLVEETLGVAAYNVLLEIEDTVTATMPVGSHFYDIEMIGPSGDVSTFLFGKVKVRRNVTR